MPRRKIIVSKKQAQVGDRVAVISSDNTIRVGTLGKNQIQYENGKTEIVFKVIGPVISK